MHIWQNFLKLNNLLDASSQKPSKRSMMDWSINSLDGILLLAVLFKLPNERKPFMEIRGALHAIEKIACSVKYKEPVLFFGETGTGKTTLVQNLAFRLCQKLTVSNLSQQSDVPDFFFGVSGGLVLGL
ncbi:hypothetical protein CDL15_Pgr011714 [Punica granatum]|uniref:ATPase dynein-related AAA domain-containing protein n=1 Tax=Punica granatum TaxID=22663 RepID=A0A218WWQ7_PUNGR|nr:hypothetical protein CDL15_Pgr011714 [Punica granatum]